LGDRKGIWPIKINTCATWAHTFCSGTSEGRKLANPGSPEKSATENKVVGGIEVNCIE